MIDILEKICPRSGLFARHLITCDGGGIIGSDYSGVILVLIINHTNETYLIKKGEQIAQFVLHKNEKILFKQVCCLGLSVRGNNGFSFTGV